MPIFASVVGNLTRLLPHARAMTPGVVLPMLRALESIMHASGSLTHAAGHSLDDTARMLSALLVLDPVLASRLSAARLEDVPTVHISSFLIHSAFSSCILKRPFAFIGDDDTCLNAAYRKMHAHCKMLFMALCCQITNPRQGEDRECTDLTGDAQITEHVPYENFDVKVKDCIKQIALLNRASLLLP